MLTALERGYRDHPPPSRRFRLRSRTQYRRGCTLARITPFPWAPNYQAEAALWLDESQPHLGQVKMLVRRRIDPATMRHYYTTSYVSGDGGPHWNAKHPHDVYGFAPEVYSFIVRDLLEKNPHLWPRRRRQRPSGRQDDAALSVASATDTGSDASSLAVAADHIAEASAKADASTSDTKAKKTPKEQPDIPQRQVILDDVLRAGMRFWHDADHVAFATVPRDRRIEQHRQKSRLFEIIVRQTYGAAHPIRTVLGPQPGPIGDSAFNEARMAMEAMALNGAMQSWDIRSIRHEGAIWIDMGDPDWHFCKITAHGWQIVTGADVPLIRTAGMRALAMPQRSSDALDRLRSFLGLSTENDLMLVVLWMVAALWPTGPYPVLAIDGGQGSGKSTKARGIVRLIDPRKTPHRAPPRDEESLLLSATNSRLIACDNVSHIEPEMADAFCRIATGGGIGKRRLYSDDEEISVFVARPVLLNGIPSLMARPDLADRAITITLPPIADTERRTEASVLAELEDAAPGIMAMFFDAMAHALYSLPTTKLPQLPRMADWAMLAAAAAPVFGWHAAGVLAALETNQRGIVADILDADPFATALQSLIARSGRWSGTAAELLTAIGEITDPDIRRERAWPKSAAGAAARLRRIAPALSRSGLSISQSRESGTGRRVIVIHEAPADPPA